MQLIVFIIMILSGMTVQGYAGDESFEHMAISQEVLQKEYKYLRSIRKCIAYGDDSVISEYHCLCSKTRADAAKDGVTLAEIAPVASKLNPSLESPHSSVQKAAKFLSANQNRFKVLDALFSIHPSEKAKLTLRPVILKSINELLKSNLDLQTEIDKSQGLTWKCSVDLALAMGLIPSHYFLAFSDHKIFTFVQKCQVTLRQLERSELSALEKGCAFA